jgi:hypothetical protein
MKNSVFMICGGKMLYRYSAIAVFLLVFLITSCIHSTPVFADLSGFQNGNFASGFTGWGGYLFSVGNVDPNTDPHFSLTAQGAQIGNDDFDTVAILYQDFQMASLASSNNTTNLNYWLQWSPTIAEPMLNVSAFLAEYDPITHETGVIIDVLGTVPMSELLKGTLVSVDVTSLADKSVRLAFALSDYDFITPDYLTVGNISFSEQGENPVPIPSSVLLLISGLAGFGVLRRKSQSSLTTGRELK